MIDKLKAIVIEKQREVDILYHLIETQPDHIIAQIYRENMALINPQKALENLRGDTLSVIAEIKRQSPSKGSLAAIPDPKALAMTYITGGANAISVLTDQIFFKGSIEDLTQVSTALKPYPQPVLRKDFIIDEIQIAEAIAAGADAILCIVAVPGDKTRILLDAARRMNIEAIVEVHDLAEIDIALNSGAEIIGINNRDLTTFEVDTQQALRLVKAIPQEIIKIAESGITDPKTAHDYYRAGFDAVLIGEALVKSDHPEKFIHACRYV